MGLINNSVVQGIYFEYRMQIDNFVVLNLSINHYSVFENGAFVVYFTCLITHVQTISTHLNNLLNYMYIGYITLNHIIYITINIFEYYIVRCHRVYVRRGHVI